MNTLVARVYRIQTSSSPTAVIDAVDELGHEHKLEVPTATARGVAPGHLLVLQWSAHAPTGGLQPPAATQSGVLPAPAPTSTVQATRSGFEALLGLGSDPVRTMP